MSWRYFDVFSRAPSSGVLTKPISARTLGIDAPISTTSGACLMPRSGSSLSVEVEHERLDGLRRLAAARVGVNRQEEIGVLPVGDARPLLEFDERVGPARHHDVDARLLLQQLLQTQGHVQHEFRFTDLLAERSGIVPAMASVDDDARDAEAQLACQ